MRKLTIFLSIFFILNAARSAAQNIPDGSTVTGTVTNTVVLPSPFSLGSTPLYNYVRTLEPQYPIANDASITESSSAAYLKMSTAYMNGYGKNIQTIIRYGSQHKDLVVPYDNRPQSDNLSFSPYPTVVNSTFHNSPYAEQSSYYNALFPDDAGTSFSENSYRSDPLSRAVYAFAPGKSAVGQRNGVRTANITNVTNEVIMWSIDPSTGWPLKTGYYPPGTLVKKVIENADGGQGFEYYDNEGKIIAKNQMSANDNCNLNNTTTVGTSTTQRMYVAEEGPLLPVNPSSPANPFTYEQQAPNQTYPISFSNVRIPFNYFISPKCPTYLITYYVYDIYDRLIYSMPPKAVEYLKINSWNPTSNIVNNLCDFNVYDDKGRIVETHHAGENGNAMNIYDRHGRLVCLKNPQDNLWWWNHYDNLNRIIETGSIQLSSYTRSLIQAWFDNLSLPSSMNVSSNILYYLYNDSQQGVYTTSALSYCDVHSYNYYDDYSHTLFYNGTSSTSSIQPYNGSLFTGAIVTGTTAVNPIQSSKTRGLLTGQVMRVIKPTGIVTLNDYVFSSNYYDDRGQIIEVAKHLDNNATDYVANQYDFKGKLLTNIEKVSNPACGGCPDNIIIKHFSYDIYTQKPTSITCNINGGTTRTLFTFTYDDLNRVKVKNVGGIEYQEYKYNIRGQLIGINPDFAETGNDGGQAITFGESIKYDQGFTKHLFCGNITGTIWRDKGYTAHAYGYTYDFANRLIQSDFRDLSGGGILGGHDPVTGAPFYSVDSWNNTHLDYTETGITYDYNGNITTLQRYGPVQTGSSIAPGKIDDLKYIYTASDISNQIQQVDDAISPASSSFTPYDFKNNSTGIDYAYDANGNLIQDNNKLLSTTYNHLNKIESRLFTGGDKMQFVYDAGGNKLREVYTTSAGVTTTDYIGNTQYKNNSLSFLSNDAGYAVKSTSGFDYFYFIKDHLGNVRNLQSSYETPYVIKYLATHELALRQTEESIFNQLAIVRDDKPNSINQSDVKAARLDAQDNTRTVGTTLLLKVMPGDLFDIAAQTYYPSNGVSNNISQGQLINSLVTALAGGGTNVGNMEAGNGRGLVQNLFTPDNLSIFQSTQFDVDSSIPLSFLNYMAFDDNFNVLPEECGRIQIGKGANSWQAISSTNQILIKNSGYFSVFISTASAGISSYFDNISINHYVGSVQEINHYYPYGLTISIASTYNAGAPSALNPLENRYLYQTHEYDKRDGLYLYDFYARQYDPQLGRFVSLDPIRQFESGYQGMKNNPSVFVDPNGKNPLIIAAIIGAVVGAAVNVAIHWDKIDEGGSIHWDKFGEAALVGGAAGGLAGFTGGASLAYAGAAGTTATTLGLAEAGVAAGGISYTTSEVVRTTGNHAFFGDPITSPEQYAKGLVISMATGGILGAGSGIIGGLPLYDPVDATGGAMFYNSTTNSWESTTATGPAASQDFLEEHYVELPNSTTVVAKALPANYWPPNNGFMQDPETITLPKDAIIDRFGDDAGRFFSPDGVPIQARSLSPATDLSDYHRYLVLKPFDVEGGIAAPWFNQPGGGIQYYSPHLTIRWLVDFKYIIQLQ